MLLWRRARGVSQDQLRTCGKASWCGLGPECTDRDPSRQGWPLHLQQPRNWGRSHVRPPRGLENFSLDQGSHRRQGPAGGLCRCPVPGPLSSSARPPWRPALPARRASPPSHVNTLIPLPLLSLLQACRETTASKGKSVGQGRGEEKDHAPFPRAGFQDQGRSHGKRGG